VFCKELEITGNCRQEEKFKNDLINYEWVSAAANWEKNSLLDYGDGDDGVDN
jgi:hypothetical protein